GWRGVNRGWGPIRCTWGNNKPDRTKTQQKIIQLHGYRSRPISRNLAEISIAYVIGKREAATSRHSARLRRNRHEGRQSQLVALGVPPWRQRRLRGRRPSLEGGRGGVPGRMAARLLDLGSPRQPDGLGQARASGLSGPSDPRRPIRHRRRRRRVRPGHEGPAQTRLRHWAATRRARRKHAKNLPGRPEPEARSPHAVEPDRQSRTPNPNHHQEGPPTSLRLRHQPRPRSDQQRLRAGAPRQRGLPQDHHWPSKRVGSQALRRHSLRRRNRTTTLNPRHRRHPPNPPRKTNPSPRLNQPTDRLSNYAMGGTIAVLMAAYAPDVNPIAIAPANRVLTKLLFMTHPLLILLLARNCLKRP